MSWWRASRRIALASVWLLLSCSGQEGAPPSSERYERLDALSALWSFYKYHYLDDGPRRQPR